MLSKITEQHMIDTIKWYLSDCRTNQVYIKNFSTFLNNFPDLPLEVMDKGKSNKVNALLRKLTTKYFM